MIKQRILFALVCAAALLLQGCAAAAGNILQPTQASGGLAVGDAGAGSLDLSDPENFKPLPGNYELAMDFRFDGTHPDGTAAAGQVAVAGTHQAVPSASTYTFTASGDVKLAGGGVFQIVTIGDQSYFYTSQAGCISVPSAANTNPFNSLVDTGGMIANTAQRVLPDETINGVPAFHYELTQDNLDLTDATTMEVREITRGAIYVAKDGGYLLRIELEGTGVSEILSGDAALEGNIAYQVDFVPVDIVAAITPPPGCEAAVSAQTEFPVMPGATSVASFEGFMSYQTTSSVEAVIDFYKTEMAAAGWNLTEENILANIAALQFTLGDRAVSVVATYDENTGVTSVIVGEE